MIPNIILGVFIIYMGELPMETSSSLMIIFLSPPQPQTLVVTLWTLPAPETAITYEISMTNKLPPKRYLLSFPLTC